MSAEGLSPDHASPRRNALIPARRLLGFASPLVLTCATFLTAAPAHAVPVTFNFTGIVTGKDTGVQGPWNAVDINDPFSLTYTFEDTATDTLPADPGRGFYSSAITAYRLTIGSVTESRAAPGIIHVFNDVPAGFDQYEVSITLLSFISFFLQADDNDNESWPTDALPTSLPALSLFDVRDWTVQTDFIFFDGEIEGSIDSFRIGGRIPEPGTLALLSLGLLGLLRRPGSH